MTAIEIVAAWLKVKTQEVKVNNPRANKGFILLKIIPDYEDRMVALTATALQILVTRLSNDSNDMPHGLCKFTETGIAVGKQIAQQASMPDLLAEKHLAIGACFIGAFLHHGYIKLYRDPGYSEYASKAPYIIEPDETFTDLANLKAIEDSLTLLATSKNSIPKVTQLLQGHGRNLIKNANDDIEQHLLDSIEEDADWVRSVNQLQAQSWKINREVFEILEDSPDFINQPVPPRPMIGSKKNVDDAFKILKDSDTKTNRDKYNHAMKLWNIELDVIVAISKNMEKELVKKKANALKDLGTFHQYVELDYRGRVYYQEPMMNFQGPDIARGLMLFGEGKPLGPSGINWLARHIAVCYNETYAIDKIPSWANPKYKEILLQQGLESISVDKMTFEDRETWTYENTDFIFSSRKAIDKDAEKPVSFLAACIEWFKCGGDIEYVSHLPIPIDGSCNGYQHSAAISKDGITGSLVSLVPQEIQSDLYVVAAKELVSRQKDFFDARPDMRMKHIRKGIAKRAVMTRAYSAGKETISESMYKDCYKEGYIDKFDIDMIDCMDLGDSMYTLIGSVCPGATKTMKFLQDLATFQLGTFKHYLPNGKIYSRAKLKRSHTRKQKLKKIKDLSDVELTELNDINKELESLELRCTRGNGSRHLEWTAPSGFHVIYEAYHTRKNDVRVTVPGFVNETTKRGQIECVLQVPTNQPNVRKYQAGISPNYIHSMDAAHMSITISNWEGSFGAVHDSFSTHACDVDELAELTRASFHAIYDSENPFEDIRDNLLHGDEPYDEDLPTLGTLEISDVLNSQYFFS